MKRDSILKLVYLQELLSDLSFSGVKLLSLKMNIKNLKNLYTTGERLLFDGLANVGTFWVNR